MHIKLPLRQKDGSAVSWATERVIQLASINLITWLDAD
jgi:hypothetical protein